MANLIGNRVRTNPGWVETRMHPLGSVRERVIYHPDEVSGEIFRRVVAGAGVAVLVLLLMVPCLLFFSRRDGDRRGRQSPFAWATKGRAK